MPRKTALFALLATLLGTITFVISSPAQAAPVRIMPLGDSITGSPGCWRALLWNRLQTSGLTNIDFVGTLPPQGCGVTYDGDNEGHGGILATNMANQNQLPPWLAATHPDIVMMHLGTNDVWSNLSPATILAAFSTLVDQMRASNPSMKILVAQILPMNPSNCAECGQRVVAFNNAIPAWAAGKSTAASPITVVDQWTGFNTATDTGDGVHPNDAGNQKISNRWYPALSGLLGGTTDTTAPTTPTGLTTSNVTSTGASLSWTASTDNVGVTGYEIWCRTGSSGSFLLVGTSTTPSFTRTGLTAGTLYECYVIARDAAGNSSAQSTHVTFTTSGGTSTGACTAVATVQSQWQTGYVIQPMTITNTSTSTITSWTVTFTLPAGHALTGSWNATVTTSGQTVTAKSVGHNGTLAPGASTTSFGYQASRPSGNTSLPSGYTCTTP
ncbi:cellulose binding domain-containing protein [Streptosporangiaceae bacterium NEAU-GS5]|nr:cellulose binding domain-containing protein [Streptosporangiaceae bacterium NEAU-GS5]